MPKVSITICAYNCEDYIRECIDSAINQTYQDFEVIIVNDGSQDRTEEIIKQCMGQYPGRIQYFYQPNSGPSSTRNRSIEKSSGEYISFLDGDDLFFSTKIEKSVQFLETQPNYAMVYTDMILINEKGEVIGPWLKLKKYFGEGNIYRNLLEECFFIPSSVMVRKNILVEVGGFDERIISPHDSDLWLRISKNHKIGLINEPLVKWRKHENNLSKNTRLTTVEMIGVFEKQLKVVGIERYDKKLIVKRLGEGYNNLADIYFTDGLFDLARQNLKKGLYYSFTFKAFVYFLLTFLPSRTLVLLRECKRKMIHNRNADR